MRRFEKYFDQFKQGEALWIKDELIAKAKVISQMKTFSYDTFKKAFAQYPPKGHSKTSIKKELKAIGVEILIKGNSTHFTEEEITSIKTIGTSQTNNKCKNKLYASIGLLMMIAQ